jgi:cytochrome c-type biogenesis protein CcmH
MKGTRKLAGLLLVALAPFVAGVTGGPPAGSDPVVAARAAELANKLRCLVCQNQSIADSNAGLAVDLRREIREQIAAGRTDDEILDFMVSRYGDFVLYRPPFRATTLALWSGPGALVLAGLWILVRTSRARRRAGVPPLTEEERKRAEQLLAGVAKGRQ